MGTEMMCYLGETLVEEHREKQGQMQGQYFLAKLEEKLWEGRGWELGTKFGKKVGKKLCQEF